MSIKFNCKCGKSYSVPDNFAGKTAACQACGKKIKIPKSPIGENSHIESVPELFFKTLDEIVEIDGAQEEEMPEYNFIDKLEEDYRDALDTIDFKVEELIHAGKEMKAVNMFAGSLVAILEIRDTLGVFYGSMYRSQDLLEKFNSRKLMQLGHPLVPLSAQMEDKHDLSESEKQDIALKFLKKIGFKKITHWYITSAVITEIEYMIDVLKILIETDFLPIQDDTEPEDNQESSRYIPSKVKISVWRRDQGKCVNCGSQEKLEYDHIIPISKGGSNTDRNIQLLCQRCNREKAAKIQ